MMTVTMATQERAVTIWPEAGHSILPDLSVSVRRSERVTSVSVSHVTALPRSIGGGVSFLFSAFTTNRYSFCCL